MRKCKSVTTVGFDATVEARDAYIEFSRTSVWVHELYGSDADGNRGEWTWFLDEDNADDIVVIFSDNPLQRFPLEMLTLPQQTAVEDAVETWMDTHDPEYVEREDGPDPDDLRDSYLYDEYKEELRADDDYFRYGARYPGQ